MAVRLEQAGPPYACLALRLPGSGKRLCAGSR